MAQVTVTVDPAITTEMFQAVAYIYGTYGLPTGTAAEKLAVVQRHLREHLKNTLREYRRQQAAIAAAVPLDTDVT